MVLTEALWDPANKGTNCTLSGSNRIATFSGVGMVRSDLSRLAALGTASSTVNAGSNNMVFGIVNASANLKPVCWSGRERLGLLRQRWRA